MNTRTTGLYVLLAMLLGWAADPALAGSQKIKTEEGETTKADAADRPKLQRRQ